METSFSGIRQKIKSQLESSTHSIKIAMAWFTNQQLFDVILNKLQRRISVELITIDDLINNGDFGLNFNQFIEAGGQLYFSPADAPVHHKFCIIDHAVVINGSYNWTYYAENRNHENITIVNYEAVAQNFNSEFERLKSILQPATNVNKRDAFEEAYFNDSASYYLQDRVYKSNVEHSQAIQQFIETNFPEFTVHNGALIKLQPPQKSLITSIGIRAVMNKEPGRFSKMIEKGTPIPCSHTRIFSLHEVTNEIAISVLYEEADYASNCKLFVEYKMKIEPGFRTNNCVEVSFRIDPFGRFNLFAKDKCVPQNNLQYNYDINFLPQ